ncbi:MAG: hypothetical protein MI976_04545 [Pseudomonadales bacterium]|nr:hypothetical protein [Pseudomonadales bacterium]
MEGNTYPARWKKQGEKFLVYLDSDKTIKGVDIDFETACDELCLALCERFGDGEAVLNLLREAPQPSGVAKYANPALVTLGWNETANVSERQDSLFVGGYCAECRAGIGARSEVPLEVDSLPKGNIGSLNQIMFSPLLLSEGFLSLLSESEKTKLGLQQIICTRNKKRKFYEVKGKPSLKQVGAKGGKYYSLSSWECRLCGHKSFSCTHPEMPDNYKYTNFISVTDLPEDNSEVFVIEDNIGRKTVCMSIARWRQISEDKYAKGILADRIYVLPEEQVEREPEVKIESIVN